MKRLYALLSVAVLLFISCNREIVEGNATPQNSDVSISFVVNLDNDLTTRATVDEDGKGIYADQCKLQIWWGDVLYCEKVVAVSNYSASFKDIILMRNQTYDFLFWADNASGDYYDTEDLHSVKLKGTYVGGDDKRDAFYNAETWDVTESFSKTVELHRPFAQLNVITKDVPTIYNQLPNKDDLSKIVPEKVAVSVTAPSVFNVKSGVASEDKLFTYEASVYTSTYKTTPDGVWNTLSMDYFYAPEDEGNLVTVGFTAKNTTSGLVDISYSWANVPLRRNWRTNIVGNLLTRIGIVDVIIAPEWDGEYEY